MRRAIGTIAEVLGGLLIYVIWFLIVLGIALLLGRCSGSARNFNAGPPDVGNYEELYGEGP